MRRKGLALLVPLLVVLGAIGAYAYFTSTGTGQAQASTGTLSAPTITAATGGAGTVALTWSTVVPPAAGAVGYYVTRDGGPAAACGTAAAPIASTSCTDTGVTAGGHSYTVTAVWRSWTATSPARAVTLASGAATRLALSAATTSPAAGADDALTIVAKDAANNTVTAYAGDKSLTFGGAPNGPDGTRPTVSDKAGAATSFGAPTTLTFTGGVATASGANNGVMRLYKTSTTTLTVTDGAIGDSGYAVTVSAAAASRLVFNQQPTNTVAGQAITPAVTVEIDDAFGNRTTSTAAVNVVPSANTLSGTVTQNAVNGVATFGDLSLTKAAPSYTLSASAIGVAGVTSGSFSIAAASASKLAFLVQPSNAVAGVTMSPAVKVEVDDAFGNLTSSTASVSLAPSSSSLSGTSPKAAVSGVATFDDLSMTTAGSYTLSAVASGLTGATSGSFSIAAASASKLAFLVQPSNAVAGVTMSPAVKVEVDDAFGNLTSSTASVSLAPSSSSLSGTSPKAAVSGVATFNDLSMTTAGSYTLSAVASGLTGATSGSFSIAAASASKLAFLVQPSNAVAGVTMSPAVKVEVDDAFGNLTSSTASVSLAPSSSSLSGTSTQTAVAGVATFGNLSMTKAGSYTLASTSAGLSGATSASFAISAASASAVTVVSGSGQSAASGVAFSNPLVALASDAFGNPVSGATVTFAAPVSGASGTFAPSGCTSNTPATSCAATTNSSGQATSSTFTANATAGSYAVAASIPNASSASFSLANTSAGPDNFLVSVSGPLTAGTPASVTITARNGTTPAAGYTGAKCITFSGPGASPSGTTPVYPARGTTCTSGQSSVTFSGGTVTGPVTLYRASAATTLNVTDGTISGSSPAFAVNSAGVALAYSSPACPASPGQLTITKGVTTSFTISAPLDAFSNPFTRDVAMPINLTLTSSDGLLFAGTPNSTTTTVSMTSGPANNTFGVVAPTGNNKKGSIGAASLPTGFTSPAPCALVTG